MVFLTRLVSKRRWVPIIVLSIANVLILSSNWNSLILTSSNLIIKLNSLNSFLPVILLIVGIYGISEILEILGLNLRINNLLNSATTIKRKLYIFLISFFATNIDVSEIDAIQEDSDGFNAYSFLSSSLSVFSTVNIYILTFILYLNTTNSISLWYYIILTFTLNIFAIVWVIKRFIDIVYEIDIHYTHNKSEALVKESITDASITYQEAEKEIKEQTISELNFKELLIVFVISSLIAIGINTYIANILPSSSFILYIAIYVDILFIALFFYTEFKIQKTGFITEKTFFVKLLVSYKNIIKSVLLLFFSLILFITNLELYARLASPLNHQRLLSFVALLIFIIIFMYAAKNMALTLAIFIPILVILTDMNIPLMLLITSLIYYVGFLCIINLSYNDKRLWFEIMFVFFTGMSALLIYFKTNNLILIYAIPVVLLIGYIIFVQLKILKEEETLDID